MEEQIKLSGVTVDCKDPKALSDFYIQMLHWEKTYEDDGFSIIASSTSDVKISFQKNIYYVPPVWPEKSDSQQQQTHLDFKVRDKAHMELMVERAIECGATKAAEQYSELWTVMIDPVGHPFCFDTL